MKKTGALLLLMAAMLVAIPAYNNAFAAQRGPAPAQQGYGPHHMGYGGPGWQHPAVTPEQQAAYDKIVTEYRDKVRPMHNDLWAKQTELEYLSRSNNADPKIIGKMVADIKALREKCQAQRDTSAGKLAKDLSISNEHAHALLGGDGCGMMGGHRGDGYGHRGGHRGGGWGGHRGGGWGWHRGMNNPAYYQQQGA